MESRPRRANPAALVNKRPRAKYLEPKYLHFIMCINYLTYKMKGKCLIGVENGSKGVGLWIDLKYLISYEHIFKLPTCKLHIQILGFNYYNVKLSDITT